MVFDSRHCDALKNQYQNVATKLARMMDETKEL
jgi:hypothetical protein